MSTKKASRGRGNQGDWTKTNVGFYEMRHHASHNAVVVAHKRARTLRRMERDGIGREIAQRPTP